MTTPATLAKVSELADWLGETITEDTTEYKRALLCLRMASALVRTEAGKTWLKPDGQLDSPPESAVMVAIYSASRAFENREAQTRGGIDDLNESWKVDEAGVYLTASERRQVAALRGGIAGISTIGTTRVDETEVLSGFVPTDTPNVEIPWY